MTKATLVACALLCAGTIHAQTVYRCGNEYSQKPCGEGKAVSVGDARSSDEARKAENQARRNADLADDMARQRIASDRKVAGPDMIVTGVRPVASAPLASASARKEKTAGKQKPANKQPGDFTAVSGAPKAKAKAKKK